MTEYHYANKFYDNIKIVIDEATKRKAEQSLPSFVIDKNEWELVAQVRTKKQAIAFFEYRPDREYDLHYDGCRGWD